MSDQFNENEIPGGPDGESVDALIRSVKEDLADDAANPPQQPFEPTIPAEYADLTTDEEPLPEEEERFRVPAVIRVLLYVCCVLAAAVLLAIGVWMCADDVCALTADDHVVMVTVEENATISEITEMLYDEGLIRYKWLFSLYCMMAGAEEKIDPGTYALNELFDYHALVNGMIATSENRATVRVTIPEGYEADDIFRMLEDNQVCSVKELQEAAANYEFDYDFLQDLEYGNR